MFTMSDSVLCVCLFLFFCLIGWFVFILQNALYTVIPQSLCPTCKDLTSVMSSYIFS